jgi:phosphoribosylformylglycinamidine cyclo-ligase
MGAEGGGREDRRLTYRDAGVDIDAKARALERLSGLVRATRTPQVLADLGAFGGLYAPDLGSLRSPVLVSSCDGVGTKLRVAFATGVHGTVGRDLVNHCVNDILVQGARPLFFLDYVATGRLDPDVLVEVVGGIARGCRETGCALLGGETAEMPGFYADGEYDVAGFVVGVVDRERIVDGRGIRPGDVLIGLGSAGLHTNGYSLARKILFEIAGLRVDSPLDPLGATVGQALLAEHRCYLQALARPLAAGLVRGMAHVTGGGLPGNLPRILPAGTAARVERGSWPVPALFDLLQRLGNVEQAEMERTFNMGLGLVLVAAGADAPRLQALLAEAGERSWRVGEIVAGGGQVVHV